MTQVYIYQAALLCEACGDAVKQSTPTPEGYDAAGESTWDSDDYPKGPYPDGGGEADYPAHCDHCGLFLENPLTDDGREYVQCAANAPHRTPEVLAWSDFYGIHPKEDLAP